MVTQFVVDLKELYTTLCNVAYDCRETPLPCAEMLDVFPKLLTPTALAEALADGWTAVLFARIIGEMEDLEEKKIPYIVCVMDGDNLFGVYNHREMSW